MLANNVINRIAFIALSEYAGFTGPLSKTIKAEIPNSSANHGIVGWKGLMAAVVWQAKQEAEAGDPNAHKWLKSEDCVNYCDALRYNNKLILSWSTRERKDKKMAILEDTQIIKRKVAERNGLPGIAIDWLRGDDESAIEEDAKKLVSFIRGEKSGIEQDVNEMTPEEIRTNANKLMKQKVNEWKRK